MIDPNERKEIESLIKLSHSYFEDLGWKEEDIRVGMTWLALLILELTRSQFNFPICNKKFGEVLRVAANLLEVNEDLMKKSGRW